EHDDVGGLGASGAHRGERLVTRRVDEGEESTVALDLVGADVLGDAAGLAGDDVRAADAVEDRGLAVVDVTHDGDDRRPVRRLVVLIVVLEEVDLEHLQQLDLLRLTGIDETDLGADLGGAQLDHVVAERLGGGDHLALLHEEADDVGRRAVQLRTEVLGRGGPLDHHDTLGHRCVLGGVGGHVHRLELLAGATTPTLATWRAALLATGTTGTTATGTTSGATTGRRASGATTGTAGTRTEATTGTPGRTRRAGATATHGRGTTTAHAGRRRDRLARGREGRAGRRRDRLARG